MNKIALFYLSMYFIFFCILLFSYVGEYLEEYNININPYDYARITDVDYKAEILPSKPYGVANITERLTFDVHAASKSNLFWELWRDLVESNYDGVSVKYNVNYVKQILNDGTEVLYPEAAELYWWDSDYVSTRPGYGPGKWYHSPGPYNPNNRNYECVLFYVDGLYREKVVFEINYDMTNAVLRYNDCSELYLSMYSGNTIKYLDSFRAQILVPNENMPAQGNYEARTYGTNSHKFSFNESSTKNYGYYTFYFNLDESDLKFRPYNQYIEFLLLSFGEDKHKFSKLASKNDYYNDNVLDEILKEQEEYDFLPFKYLEIKLVLFSLCLAISFVLINRLLKADDNIEYLYNFYTPEIDFDYFREIPSDLDPLFAANLVFCKETGKTSKITKNGYAAILLSLVRKKYIELRKINENKDWKPNNVNIVVLHNSESSYTGNNIKIVNGKIIDYDPENYSPRLEALTKNESYYFNLIVRHVNTSNSISMQSFQDKILYDYENTNTFIKNLEKSTLEIGITQKYFQNSKYDAPKKILKRKSIFCTIIGFIILILVNYISYQTRLDLIYGGISLVGISFLFGGYIFSKLSKKYILLTQFGEDEYSKWRGLYNFLNSETLMNERTIIELPIWEKYLVYATAFGISEKVIKAIKIRCPDMETSPILKNNYYYSHTFYHSCSSFRSNAIHASNSARFGGYSSGYGGGGRGGGGGRRWSLKL